MKKWRCTVCNYIHEGETPPDVCPVCGVGPEMFEEVVGEPAAEKMTEAEKKEAKPAIYKLSYGLFVVSSKKGDKINAQASNTAFQITSDPVTIAIGVNKNNLTWDYINESEVFCVNILGQDQIDTIKKFGFQSGRKVDKFEEVPFVTDKTGAPILKDCLGWLECEVREKVDLGTHTLFVGEVVKGKGLKDKDPLTYAYYREHKSR